MVRTPTLRTVYSWGTGRRGQLGLGDKCTATATPQPIKRAVHDAAIAGVGPAATGSGRAMNSLAPSSFGFVDMPTIVAVSCGEEHTLALSAGGLVYTVRLQAHHNPRYSSCGNNVVGLCHAHSGEMATMGAWVPIAQARRFSGRPTFCKS